MRGKGGLLAVAAAVLAALAWSRRPVKPPPSQGTWAPTDQARSRS